VTAKAWVAIALGAGLLGAAAGTIVWSAISNGGVAINATKARDVSGKSPFSQSCSLTARGGVPSFDSEIEPSLAASPRNANVLIGVYQQDRLSYGQARGIVASVSHDGGETWRQVPTPAEQVRPEWPPLRQCRGSVGLDRAGWNRVRDCSREWDRCDNLSGRRTQLEGSQASCLAQLCRASVA
jgi:hypothetical protein